MSAISGLHAAIRPELLSRRDVQVSRKYGWVTHKRDDSIVGCVWRDVNAAGKPIWRANAGDIGAFSFTHSGAVETVLELHNMQEKARAYDLLARAVSS